MKLSSATCLCLAALWASACGSNNNPTNSSAQNSTSGSGSGSSGGGSGSGSGSSSGSSSSGGANDGGSSAASDAGACPAMLKDKVTVCTGTEPPCADPCGPDMTTGTLGSKTCSCNANTMVYNCQGCGYPAPLPSCYMPATTPPPACDATVANKGACMTACGGVCTILSDAGKTQGCVCIQKASGNVYTCASQWWQ